MLIVILNAIDHHLKEAKMTYSQHMKYALKIACRLGYASLALVLHSICPCIFQKTGSETIRILYNQLLMDNVIVEKRKILRID